MSAYTKSRVYVPNHVNRDSIIKCYVDKDIEFISVATEQEAIELETASSTPFFVFEQDYFIFCNSPEGTVRCSYWSRNHIMDRLLGHSPDCWKQQFHEKDGLKVSPYPPVVYFLPAGFTNSSLHVVLCSVVVYYESMDIGVFAQSVREMDSCNQKFFVAAHDSTLECVEVENTENRAEFTMADIIRYAPLISEDPVFIKRYMEHVRNVRENRPGRLPNGQFKLKDCFGDDVRDGEQFRLIFYFYDDHSYYTGEDPYDDSEPEYAGFEMPSGRIAPSMDGGSIFTSETIDDIVYLRYNEHYLYCSDDGGWQIKLMPELPEENERLHVQYDRKMLTFSRWNKIGCLHVSWYRHTGDVYFLEDNVIDPYDRCLALELVKI